MTDPDNTGPETLLRAARIGQEAGLRYVYAGNLPGLVGRYENTYCPQCHTLLVGRSGYLILEYHLTDQGACPTCLTPIPGIWWGEDGFVYNPPSPVPPGAPEPGRLS
jgi:pyruvate formate lyase activating enzyme